MKFKKTKNCWNIFGSFVLSKNEDFPKKNRWGIHPPTVLAIYPLVLVPPRIVFLCALGEAPISTIPDKKRKATATNVESTIDQSVGLDLATKLTDGAYFGIFFRSLSVGQGWGNSR